MVTVRQEDGGMAMLVSIGYSGRGLLLEDARRWLVTGVCPGPPDAGQTENSWSSAT
jgi:hypothetical protein